MHTDDLEFEWDAEKERANRRKHGVHFADAQSIFQDTLLLLREDENLFEQRFIAIGRTIGGNILLVCFTWRGERIRLISARKADVLERQQYEEGL